MSLGDYRLRELILQAFRCGLTIQATGLLLHIGQHRMRRLLSGELFGVTLTVEQVEHAKEQHRLNLRERARIRKW